MCFDPRMADGSVAIIIESYQAAILGTWGISDAGALDAEPAELGVSSVVCTPYLFARMKAMQVNC